MKALVIALVALVSAVAVAGGPRIPRPSPLTLASLTTKNQHHAEFAGQVWVTGSLYVEWSDGREPTAGYRLIPHAKSSKQLPHFARYGVTWIGLKNGPAALRMAVSQDIYQHVIDRQIKLFKVTGDWKLDAYAVGIECDAPYAYATVVAAEIPDQRLVASIARPETC